MKSKLRPIIFLMILAVIFFEYSCSLKVKEDSLEKAFRLAGDNKIELQKVIDHYKENPEDSLKLQAAIFLIENMTNHSWQSGFNKFEFAFDSISNFPFSNLNLRRDIFESLLDSIAKIPTSDNLIVIKDIETLGYEFLIENIDLAFEAWYKYPVDKRADFESFCNYILPYRNKDELIEPETRKEFMEHYSWVFDSLNANIPLKNVADRIIKNFNYQNLLALRSKYPLPLSIKQFEKSRIGVCQDEVTYFVHLFRALGISSSDDFVDHWGNHHSLGHNWLRLKFGNEIYYESPDVEETYKYESIPKVFRRTFSTNLINDTPHLYVDVISDYKETVDVEVPILFNNPKQNHQIVICVFDVKREWYKVSGGEVLDNKLLFKNMGTNVLYLSGYYSLGQLYPVNYPFFVSQDKSIHYFNPKKEVIDSIVLLRKSGFLPYRDTRWKKKTWLDNLNGGQFQAADNPLFDNSEQLAKLNHFNSTQPQEIVVKNKKAFKYVRFLNEKESYLAQLHFIGLDGKRISGTTINTKDNKEINWEEGAFDDNPLTYSGGNEFYLGIKLDKAQPIGVIRFQARNDDNHIRVGDQYELFYWDKSWRSLGRKTATDTMLFYRSTPKNSLLWLRNLTRGKEENAFTVTENGFQKWLGFYK